MKKLLVMSVVMAVAVCAVTNPMEDLDTICELKEPVDVMPCLLSVSACQVLMTYEPEEVVARASEHRKNLMQCLKENQMEIPEFLTTEDSGVTEYSLKSKEFVDNLTRTSPQNVTDMEACLLAKDNLLVDGVFNPEAYMLTVPKKLQLEKELYIAMDDDIRRCPTPPPDSNFEEYIQNTFAVCVLKSCVLNVNKRAE